MHARARKSPPRCYLSEPHGDAEWCQGGPLLPKSFQWKNRVCSKGLSHVNSRGLQKLQVLQEGNELEKNPSRWWGNVACTWHWLVQTFCLQSKAAEDPNFIIIMIYKACACWLASRTQTALPSLLADWSTTNGHACGQSVSWTLSASPSVQSTFNSTTN